MHTIVGPLAVSVGNVDHYTVAPADGLAYTWTVTGGSVQSGQGTSSVAIRWTAPGQCTVSVTIQTATGPEVVIIDPNAQ